MKCWECWTLSPFSLLTLLLGGFTIFLSTELFWLGMGFVTGKINLLSYPFQCNGFRSCAHLGYCNFLTGIWTSHPGTLFPILSRNQCCCERTKSGTSYSSILLTSYDIKTRSLCRPLFWERWINSKAEEMYSEAPRSILLSFLLCGFYVAWQAAQILNWMTFVDLCTGQMPFPKV